MKGRTNNVSGRQRDVVFLILSNKVHMGELQRGCAEIHVRASFSACVLPVSYSSHFTILFDGLESGDSFYL